MIPTYAEPYNKVVPPGELRIGWASWDKRKFKERSIKYVYRDKSGKISRGAPELDFTTLVEMVLLAEKKGELAGGDLTRLRARFSK